MSEQDDPSFHYTRIPSGPPPGEVPTHDLVIDDAGNWIFKPIQPLPEAAPYREPDPASWQTPDAEPEQAPMPDSRWPAS